MNRNKEKRQIHNQKVHVTTLGCAKNIYDSEILLGQLRRAGLQIEPSAENADIIVINTCGFITPAKQESIDAILEAEQIKKKHSEKKLIVCGCLVQRYRKELQEELPWVDGFFGTEAFSDILHFLKLKNGSPRPEHLYENRFTTTPSHYAYLKISEGCDHTCAFCAIPAIRGRHRSRPMEEILQEAHQLAEQGVKELIIVAQDTTYYGIDRYRRQKLVELLQQLESIDGIRWIRLHYLYPTSVQDELLETMAASQKIVPYLDMPIQHISDRMLKIMKRGGNSRRIREIFQRIRELIPEITLRTTFIVGHPGETENDFEELKSFVKEMEFDRLGVFTYSHEEGTPAYSMSDLPEEIKHQRYSELMEIQREISLRKNSALIGTTKLVILDEIDLNDQVAYGRTPGDSPEIDNEVVIEMNGHNLNAGDFTRVLIQDATEYEIYGIVKGVV